MLSIVIYLIAISTYVNAIFVPLTPSPGQSFNVGSIIETTWSPDTTSEWSDMTIELMTGSNYVMVPLAVAGANINAALTTSFKFVAPDVNLYAPVYFLQFSNSKNSSDVQWVTRFTIASSTGQVQTAPNATQSDGQAIPWGIGRLVKSVKVNEDINNSSTLALAAAAAAQSVETSTSVLTVTPDQTSVTVTATSTATATSTQSASIPSFTSISTKRPNSTSTVITSTQSSDAQRFLAASSVLILTALAAILF